MLIINIYTIDYDDGVQISIYVFNFIELCNNIKSIKTISEIDIE